MTRADAVWCAQVDAWERVSDLWSRPVVPETDLFRRSEASQLAEWEGVLDACKRERARLSRRVSYGSV